MDKKQVDNLFDELIGQVDAQIQALRLEAAQALQRGDYDKHDEVYGKVKPLNPFPNKLRDLKQEWENLTGSFVPIPPPEPIKIQPVISTSTIVKPLPRPDRPVDKPTSDKRRYPNPRRKYALKVIFPNGTTINEEEASDTFVKTIEYIGVEKVFILKLGLRGGDSYPLVSTEVIDGQASKPVGNYFIQTHCSTDDKVRRLKDISRLLRLNLRVEFNK